MQHFFNYSFQWSSEIQKVYLVRSADKRSLKPIWGKHIPLFRVSKTPKNSVKAKFSTLEELNLVHTKEFYVWSVPKPCMRVFSSFEW